MKKIVIFVVTFSMMATLGGFTIWKIRENRDRSGELYEFKTEMPELTKEDVSEPSYPFGGKTAYKLLISLKGKQVVELSYITDWETEAQYLLEITEDKLKIRLANYEKEVSRTILVPIDINFEELHECIQKAMGWKNEHLYNFKIGEVEIESEEEQAENEIDQKESIYTKINELLRKGDKFQYTYDYGDDWQHDIEVLETIEFGSKKPLILEGTGACPKENSR